MTQNLYYSTTEPMLLQRQLQVPLADLVTTQAITTELAKLCEQVWFGLVATHDRPFPLPAICPGDANNLMYTWNHGEHYLECEIFEQGEIEFFYRNRHTGETWGEDLTAASLLTRNPFSQEVLQKTSLFIE
jgi:hypothetical protein